MKSDIEKKKYPDYPVLEEGTYTEDIEKGIADAERKAAEMERQAKRDRDMALIGDMAHLVTQGAAMHGGAWKIGQTQSEGAKGNERLRVLREKNAAQTAAFAKERAALREAKRKEENARKLAAYNAEVERYKREVEAEKYVKEQERKDRQEAREVQLNTAKINYYNRGGKSNGSKENKDVFLVNDDGSITTFAHADDANNLQAAYAKLPNEYKAKKAVPRTETIRGRKVYIKDKDGKQVYDYEIDLEASLEQKRQAISDYNSRELIEVWVPDEDEIIDYIPNK